MSKIVLLLGGARSGKSSFATRLAQNLANDQVHFIATAQPLDEEMKDRIAHHQQDRPESWQLSEQPYFPAVALEVSGATQRAKSVVVLDCLTILTANWLMFEEGTPEEREHRLHQAVGSFLTACRDQNLTAIIVSGEVGSGVVPAVPSGRQFRDWLGRLNQILAQQADECLLMVSGLPLDLKTQSTTLDDVTNRLQS